MSDLGTAHLSGKRCSHVANNKSTGRGAHNNGWNVPTRDLEYAI